ncbi:MAG: polynucleotide adenylyltransferase PcnB [Fibrobacteres bacterium]|nr:polynucleotide adenylyltransferase PcnB [Fibrobacterota bacterium]
MIQWFLRKIKKNKKGPLRVSDPRITQNAVDEDAFKVIRRLQSFHYKAYVVGGAIRDSLLGIAPKDWDIVTSASPNEIKKIFRNSFIIGRRFRLVHVKFHGNKVIETATFRKHHGKNESDGPIDSDNVFGTESDDAFRRDFTINALFYDPVKNIIIDHVGGLEDLKNKTLRCIGDPKVRLSEDPVRILRAIKFAAKFNLRIEKGLASEMVKQKDAIKLCSQRRLFEELAKILRSGLLEKFIKGANEFNFLGSYLPPVDLLNKTHHDQLIRTARFCDQLAVKSPDDITTQYSLLLWPFIRMKNEKIRDIQQAIRFVFSEMSDHFQMSKLERMQMRTLLVLLPRFEYLLDLPKGPKRKASMRKLMRSQFFEPALELLKLTELAECGKSPKADAWRGLYETRNTELPPEIKKGIKAPNSGSKPPLDTHRIKRRNFPEKRNDYKATPENSNHPAPRSDIAEPRPN